MKKRRSFSREFKREAAGMVLDQVSLKTEWLSVDHETAGVAREDVGRYLLGYYNWKRPRQANWDLAPARTEQQLKIVSGFYCPLPSVIVENHLYRISAAYKGYLWLNLPHEPPL